MSDVKDNAQDKPITHHKTDGCAGAVMEAYTSFTDAAPRRLRQAQVAADGFFIGAAKQVPKQLFTCDTAGKVVVGASGGLLFGALLAVESPVIVGGALLVGGIGIGVCTTNTWNNLSHDKELGKALNGAYNSGDQKAMASSFAKAERSLGQLGFDFGIVIAAGGTTGLLSKAFTRPLGTLMGWLPLKSGAFSPAAFLPTFAEKQIIAKVLKEGNQLIPDGIRLTSLNRPLYLNSGLQVDIESATGREFTDEEFRMLLRIGHKLKSSKQYVQVRTPNLTLSDNE